MVAKRLDGSRCDGVGLGSGHNMLDEDPAPPHRKGHSPHFCNKSSAVAELGDRLATLNMGRKVGGCCTPPPFFLGGGSWVPIEHNVAWAEAYVLPT